MFHDFLLVKLKSGTKYYKAASNFSQVASRKIFIGGKSQQINPRVLSKRRQNVIILFTIKFAKRKVELDADT